MATPTSYLQTLSQDEAIAFITSLQKVKVYLSSELEWMTQQVQQKTTQLQGIETLLSEAISLGLLTSDANLPPDAGIGIPTPPASTVKLSSASINDSPPNGNAASTLNLETASSHPAAPSIPSVSASATPQASNNKNQTVNSSSTQSPVKSTVSHKSSVAKTKGSGSSLKSASKGSRLTKNKELRELLVPRFRGGTLTDAVAQILENATKPLHLNELLSEMYGTLSADDFKRAKVSLANVLSIGKNEGKWKNLGQGMYTSNTTAKS
ncbi:hypothetical protein OsccyDRAFT_4693 [Leptolyngbyaceae cyanobacterium JSC-12]|nr:hypothetical protein OsccyDRAFT_4693 [Leptolyngbyaceae cyanobacterium JSC-12]